MMPLKFSMKFDEKEFRKAIAGMGDPVKSAAAKALVKLQGTIKDRGRADIDAGFPKSPNLKYVWKVTLKKNKKQLGGGYVLADFIWRKPGDEWETGKTVTGHMIIPTENAKIGGKYLDPDKLEEKLDIKLFPIYKHGRLLLVGNVPFKPANFLSESGISHRTLGSNLSVQSLVKKLAALIKPADTPAEIERKIKAAEILFRTPSRFRKRKGASLLSEVLSSIKFKTVFYIGVNKITHRKLTHLGEIVDDEQNKLPDYYDAALDPDYRE